MNIKISNDNVFFNDSLIGQIDKKRSDGDIRFIELEEREISILLDSGNSKLYPTNLEIFFWGRENHVGYRFIKRKNKLEVTCNFSIDVITWEEKISIKRFNKLFRNEWKKYKKWEFESIIDRFGDNYYDIFITFEFDYDLMIKEAVHIIKNKFEKVKSKIINFNKIENIISFSPEHLSAGSSILQYFGKLLQEKYPDEKVSVSIKQEGLKVTMIIETPDSKKEEIEEYLNKYGMVIMNQLPPEEFTVNPIQLLELKQELRDAQNKIAFQQELLILKDDTYKNRVLTLEDEVKFLREEFSALRTSNNENIQQLLSSLMKKDKLMKKLTKSIEKRDDKETEQLLLKLKDKDNQGYVSLKEHIDTVIVGGVVNAPSWIQFVLTHFPK